MENIKLVWGEIPIIDTKCFMYECHPNQFYLNIPSVARFLALPEKNQIVIEKANPKIDEHSINTWLSGTVMAYFLQYHGYLVLHGSSILINNKAVIFSGQSGAGKSTLASALMKKGFPFITDDLIVIKRNEQNQFCIIPGPAQLKLWHDGVTYFNYDLQNAMPIHPQIDKYVIPVQQTKLDSVDISAFYELNRIQQMDSYDCQELNKTESLKIIMKNAYRFFMLKPLGQLQHFFNECSTLAKQLSVYKILRPDNFNSLPKIIQLIESKQGLVS